MKPGCDMASEYIDEGEDATLDKIIEAMEHMLLAEPPLPQLEKSSQD
jgi:hypothetical protein